MRFLSVQTYVLAKAITEAQNRGRKWKASSSSLPPSKKCCQLHVDCYNRISRHRFDSIHAATQHSMPALGIGWDKRSASFFLPSFSSSAHDQSFSISYISHVPCFARIFTPEGDMSSDWRGISLISIFYKNSFIEHRWSQMGTFKI